MTADHESAERARAGVVMRKLRLHFWLYAMDVTAWLGCFRAPRESRRFAVYLWCVERASNATDWGDA